MTPSYLLFINHVTPGYINTAPCNAQLFVTKKTKDGQRRQPGGRHPQMLALKAASHHSSTPKSAQKDIRDIAHGPVNNVGIGHSLTD
jgi:hypothetical protein